MQIYNIKDMVRGWFIGAFAPSILHTPEFEVGIKRFKSGERESRHVHKVSTEVTVVISGTIEIAGRVLQEDEAVVLEPGEESEFHSVTDSILVVVKMPSALGDKYLC